jgi:predicted transcriptional regulator
MRDKKLKLVAVNASRTLVERQGVCREREMERRGKWRGCRCYLLTDTRSRRISLAGKKAERWKRGSCVHV